MNTVTIFAATFAEIEHQCGLGAQTKSLVQYATGGKGYQQILQLRNDLVALGAPGEDAMALACMARNRELNGSWKGSPYLIKSAKKPGQDYQSYSIKHGNVDLKKFIEKTCSNSDDIIGNWKTAIHVIDNLLG